MTRLAIAFFFLASAWGQYSGMLVPAANYYVSPSGSDSNAGTSVAAPFQTISKLCSTLAAGQTGAVYSGQYRDECNLVGAGEGLAGWGPQMPLIDCSNAIASGAWSNYMGNVYQATVTTDNAGGTGFMTFYYGGSAYPSASNGAVTQSASLTALASATPPSYFVANNGTLTGTTQTLYVNTGVNPATDTANLYEYSARNQCVSSQYSATVSNIWTRRNQANNGSFQIGPNSFATSIEADQGTKHNFFAQGGSYDQYIVAHDSYYTGMGKTAFILDDNFPTGQPYFCVYCSYVETFEQTGEGFYGHTENVAGFYGYVACINCSTTGAFASVGGWMANYNVVIGGTFNAPITLGGGVGNLLQGATVSGPVNVDTSTGTFSVVNSIIEGAFTNGAIRVSFGVPLVITGTTFSNSTSFDADIYVNEGVVLPCLTMTGNTFLAPVAINYLLIFGTTPLPPGCTTSNFNTFHYPAAANAGMYFPNAATSIYNFSSAPGFAAWQALGYDASSTRTTP